MKTRILFGLTMLALAISPAVAQETSSDTNMQILRDKVKADKKLLIAENLQLTDAEGKAFWPLYDGYQAELAKINDRLAAAIDAYAKAYSSDTLTDELARKLMTDAIGVEQSEAAMRSSYAAKMSNAIPARKAARYMQIESKIRALVRFDLAANIPLMK
jgi:hypothetical protein